MLTIRKEQIEKFGEFIEANFKVNSMKMLRDKYPQETKDKKDQEMMAFINLGIEKAEKYDIIERRDISMFLEYMICYGKEFDTNIENKWAIEILKIKDIPGEEKISRMLTMKPL